MGIKYLNSFVNNYGLRENYRLQNTKLVIDGNNVMYNLYVEYNHKSDDYLYGGNYSHYLLYFRQFFKNLKKCKIEPILVFDGGLNLDLKDNRIARFEQSFNKSKRISESIHTDYDLIFPYLLRDAFVSVIHELNIDSFQTTSDADLDCAKLANTLKCPLLSDDSDFFILNLEFGVISYQSFQWKTPKQLNDNKMKKELKLHFIKCKLYKIDNFLNKFTHLEREMLPIFSSLMGNDYIEGEIFNDLLNEITSNRINQQWISERVDERINKSFIRMNQILIWLSEEFEDYSHAINHINKYLESKGKDAINLFKVSLNSYETGDNKTYLFQLFNHKIIGSQNIDIPDEQLLKNLIEINGQLPKWFLIEFHFNTNLKSVLMSFLKTKILFLKPLIEDFSLQSCYECSYDLYGFIHALLRSSEEDITPLKLKSRKGFQIYDIEIVPKHYLNGGLEKLPLLTEIRKLSDIERKDLFLKLLNFSEHIINNSAQSFNDKYLGINEDIEFWTFLVLVIKYWMENTKTKDWLTFVHALLLNVIYHKFSQNYDEKEFNALTEPTENSLSPKIVHYYSEFQVCYTSIKELSSLLNHPISCGQIHCYLNGILIYNLFNKINNKNIPKFKTRRLHSIYLIVFGVILNKSSSP